jgi:hypothetical protein
VARVADIWRIRSGNVRRLIGGKENQREYDDEMAKGYAA